MTTYKKMMAACLALLFCFLLAGCSDKTTVPEETNNRRGLETDTCLEDHAGPYIALFQQDYPNMEITKVRWQSLDTGDETYVIEGVDGNRKCIVKYLMANQMVLGRTERELLEEEICDDVCIEKPLDLSCMLTQTELCEIAIKELGGEMHELKIFWKDDRPLAYAEVRDEHLRATGIVLDACTGEILY